MARELEPLARTSTRRLESPPRPPRGLRPPFPNTKSMQGLPYLTQIHPTVPTSTSIRGMGSKETSAATLGDQLPSSAALGDHLSSSHSRPSFSKMTRQKTAKVYKNSTHLIDRRAADLAAAARLGAARLAKAKAQDEVNEFLAPLQPSWDSSFATTSATTHEPKKNGPFPHQAPPSGMISREVSVSVSAAHDAANPHPAPGREVPARFNYGMTPVQVAKELSRVRVVLKHQHHSPPEKRARLEAYLECFLLAASRVDKVLLGDTLEMLQSQQPALQITAAGVFLRRGFYFSAMRAVFTNPSAIRAVLHETRILLEERRKQDDEASEDALAGLGWAWGDADRELFTAQFQHLELVTAYRDTRQRYQDAMGQEQAMASVARLDREILLKVVADFTAQLGPEPLEGESDAVTILTKVLGVAREDPPLDTPRRQPNGLARAATRRRLQNEAHQQLQEARRQAVIAQMDDQAAQSESSARAAARQSHNERRFAMMRHAKAAIQAKDEARLVEQVRRKLAAQRDVVQADVQAISAEEAFRQAFEKVHHAPPKPKGHFPQMKGVFGAAAVQPHAMTPLLKQAKGSLRKAETVADRLTRVTHAAIRPGEEASMEAINAARRKANFNQREKARVESTREAPRVASDLGPEGAEIVSAGLAPLSGAARSPQYRLKSTTATQQQRQQQQQQDEEVNIVGGESPVRVGGEVNADVAMEAMRGRLQTNDSASDPAFSVQVEKERASLNRRRAAVLARKREQRELQKAASEMAVPLLISSPSQVRSGLPEGYERTLALSGMEGTGGGGSSRRRGVGGQTAGNWPGEGVETAKSPEPLRGEASVAGGEMTMDELESAELLDEMKARLEVEKERIRVLLEEKRVALENARRAREEKEERRADAGPAMATRPRHA